MTNLQQNIDRNIRLFTLWFLPLIAVSKLVRWTVMLNQLVWMSMGHQMINRMNTGQITPFHASLFSDVSNNSSVIMSNSEALFSAINLFGLTTYVEWEWFFSIIFNLLFYFIIRTYYKNNPAAGWKENLFIYLNLAILNIFCLNMAKEPLQLIVFLLMYWALNSFKRYNTKVLALAIVLILSVLYCRKYYALVLGYFFVLQVLVRRWFDNVNFSGKLGQRKLYFRILMLFVLFGVAHYFFLGFLEANNEETYEEMVDANTRVGTGAVSEITPFFTGNQFLLAFDYFIKIFRLMFPVELLLRGKFTYVFMIVYQVLLAIFLVRAFRKRRINEVTVDIEYDDEDLEDDNEEDDDESDDTDDESDDDDDDDDEIEYIESDNQKDIRTVALYLYIAFLLCSAAFEPDFGSWVRHEGVAFPVILLIL